MIDSSSLFPTTIVGHSVLSSWVRAICQTARGYNIDPIPLMKTAGLDPDLLNIPDARYPVNEVRAFWRILIRATKDPLLGLKVGEEVQMSSLHGLGLAMMTSASLSDLLMLFVRYAKTISTNMQLNFEHEAHTTSVVFKNQDNEELHITARLASMVLLYRQACSLAQRRIIPKYITLSFSYDDLQKNLDRIITPTVYANLGKRLDAYFHTPVTLGAEQDSISFSYQDTIEPYAGSHPQLMEVNEAIVREYLTRLHKSDLSSQVLMRIQDYLSKGEPKLDEVAQSLNMTARTLQRRLRAENLSFQILLDTERKKHAHQLLAHTKYNMTEISYLLGFSDVSNLSRACKRWFNQSPSEHRESNMQVSA